MKIKLLILLFMGFFVGQAQVSTMRINDVKLGMTKASLETLIGKKIPLKLNEYDYPEGETKIVYKGIPYTIHFGYMNEKDFTVSYISSKHASLQTLSGIKLGDSIETLFNKYKSMNFRVYQVWDLETEKRDPNQRIFSIEDYDNGSTLDFKLKNNKIIEFSVMYNEGC